MRLSSNSLRKEKCESAECPAVEGKGRGREGVNSRCAAPGGGKKRGGERVLCKKWEPIRSPVKSEESPLPTSVGEEGRKKGKQVAEV